MQINLIVRSDAANDLREAMKMIRNMWNRHHASSKGIMVISFAPYEKANFRLMREAREMEEETLDDHL